MSDWDSAAMIPTTTGPFKEFAVIPAIFEAIFVRYDVKS